ncbi:MAG TPA: SIMPL domain-containing protein [Allosphingosinicella sp.]|nr:SIMPL domain-containing protein [Allosphingosinicella sp.]
MRLVIAAFALALAGAASAQNAPFELRAGETLLEVESVGAELSRPDVMTVEAGVVTVAPTATAAARANADLARRLIDAIRAMGVASADIRTDVLRVMPQFDRQARERTGPAEPGIIGYTATNELGVRVRDLDRAPVIIDAMLAAGANRVAGPNFSLADDAAARRTARQRAVAEARTEAEDYAAALGLRVSRVLRVSERSAAHYGESRQFAVSGSRISGTPIEPGQVRTEIRVWVDFVLVPR